MTAAPRRFWKMMTSVLLDASALIAMARDEPGGDVVAAHLERAAISTVNLSEVYSKAHRRNATLEGAVQQISKLPLSIFTFSAEEAAIAASLLPKAKPLGLSFADRACLAVAMNRGMPVLTSDHE